MRQAHKGRLQFGRIGDIIAFQRVFDFGYLLHHVYVFERVGTLVDILINQATLFISETPHAFNFNL